MALPAMALSLTPSSIQISKRQLHSSSVIHALNRPTSATCFVKLPTMAQNREPPKLMMHIDNVRGKLSEAVPQPLKEFPWKRAEIIVLQQLLLVGKEALKWSLLVLYICSTLSDVLYTISRNKELMIPFGLFIGYMVINFLLETSQELFPISEEKDQRRNLLGIACVFAFTKFISSYFMVRGRFFLLHVANGGLMQVLWLLNNQTGKA